MSLFGTDGIRGKAGSELTTGLAHEVCRAAARFLQGLTDAGDRRGVRRGPAGPGGSHRRGRGERLAVVVGHDTRPSSPELAEACAEGFARAGLDVVVLGVVPTATVAYAVDEFGYLGGCVVSASHNPPEDNGIKFFGPSGFKLSDEEERQVEEIFRKGHGSADRATSPAGRLLSDDGTEIVEAYLRHLVEAGGSAEKVGHVVVDCAEGAASVLGPEVFRRMGLEVSSIAASGDGTKINLGSGATNPSNVALSTREQRADLGFAFDGDADRVVVVDSEGSVYDGDAILYVLAKWMSLRGELVPPVVVTTVMSNYGLSVALRKLGVSQVECPVGDKYVAEAMRREGARLGGEQSGHVVLAQLATTGDGLLTAAVLLRCISETRSSLAQLTADLERFPQVLVNVEVRDKIAVASSATVRDAVKAATEALSGRGRVLVRPSGTEDVVRIMVEAAEEDTARRIADSIARAALASDDRRA